MMSVPLLQPFFKSDGRILWIVGALLLVGAVILYGF